MKKYIVGLTIFFVIGIAWVEWTSEVRDPKLMALCPDFETQTMHECK